MTVQRQIRDHIAGVLNASPLCDGGVHPYSRRPMPEQNKGMVFVYLSDSPAIPTAMGQKTEWNTRVRVECVARSHRPTPSDPIVEAEDYADSIGEEVYRRVMQDTRLGGLALDTTCHLAWISDEAETGVSSCQVVVSVKHRTMRNDANILT